jgi:cardiolipin synthase
MGALTTSRRWYFQLGVFIAALGLASCRLLPPRDPGSEARQVRQCAEHSVRARVSADGHRLGLRFLLKGRDAFASTTLTDASPAGLAFQADAATTAAFLGKAPRPIPVFNSRYWRLLADTLALRLAPANPGEGCLILAGGRELIAHRVNGKGVLTPLDQRTRALKVVRSIKAAALAEEVFHSRGDALDLPGGKKGPLLLLTGSFPELVYLDHAGHQLRFLPVPPEAETGLPLTTWTGGGQFLRQLTSFVWHSHIAALLKSPFSTSARFLASGASIATTGVEQLLSRLPEGPPPPLGHAPEMDPAAWQETLSHIASAPLSSATLKLRLGGDEFFPDFIQAVQEARRSVDVQLYIFDNDDYAAGLADLFRKRSREGVQVRILVDESASLAAAANPPDSPMPADYVPPDNMLDYLERGSNVQVRRMPMSGLTASHTKIISIDGQTAWLGGMNIGREYRYDWHDLMIEVRGPLVAWISQDFNKAWARHGWAGDFALARHVLLSPARAAAAAAAPPGAVPVQPFYTSAWHHEIVQAQLAALRRCQRSVWLENAYLSDDAFITELVRARHRGVDVRIIMPAANDNGVMAANNRALIPILRRHGIRVFLLPGMSHVKAALYDGWACLGSANFDRLSLHVNNEFSIGCSDPTLIRDLRQRLFTTDFQRSQEITGQPLVSPGDEVLNALIRGFAGQL